MLCALPRCAVKSCVMREAVRCSGAQRLNWRSGYWRDITKLLCECSLPAAPATSTPTGAAIVVAVLFPNLCGTLYRVVRPLGLRTPSKDVIVRSHSCSPLARFTYTRAVDMLLLSLINPYYQSFEAMPTVSLRTFRRYTW